MLGTTTHPVVVGRGAEDEASHEGAVEDQLLREVQYREARLHLPPSEVAPSEVG